MTIEVEHGSVGPEGGPFMYVASRLKKNFLSTLDGGPTAQEVVEAVDAKVEELGLTLIASTRDYIHNDVLKVAVLAMSVDSRKAALAQMQNQLHMGPGPFTGV